MPYSEAQKRATQKYKERNNYVKINLDVTANNRERFKTQAAKRGLSLSAYIIQLIEKDMQED